MVQGLHDLQVPYRDLDFIRELKEDGNLEDNLRILGCLVN